jgi:hypothetical protein
MTGGLFGDEVVSATNLHTIKRATASNRAQIAAEQAMSTRDPWVIWCDTDYESDAIMSALGKAPDVVEVRGSMKSETKEANLDAFALGNARVMVTKPSVSGCAPFLAIWTDSPGQCASSRGRGGGFYRPRNRP